MLRDLNKRLDVCGGSGKMKKTEVEWSWSPDFGQKGSAPKDTEIPLGAWSTGCFAEAKHLPCYDKPADTDQLQYCGWYRVVA